MVCTDLVLFKITAYTCYLPEMMILIHLNVEMENIVAYSIIDLYKVYFFTVDLSIIQMNDGVMRNISMYLYTSHRLHFPINQWIFLLHSFFLSEFIYSNKFRLMKVHAKTQARSIYTKFKEKIFKQIVKYFFF